MLSLIALGGLVFYFLPSLIGAARGKRNALALFVFNLLLGWTFVGWVIAFVWSLMSDPV